MRVGMFSLAAVALGLVLAAAGCGDKRERNNPQDTGARVAVLKDTVQGLDCKPGCRMTSSGGCECPSRLPNISVSSGSVYLDWIQGNGDDFDSEVTLSSLPNHTWTIDVNGTAVSCNGGTVQTCRNQVIGVDTNGTVKIVDASGNEVGSLDISSRLAGNKAKLHVKAKPHFNQVTENGRKRWKAPDGYRIGDITVGNTNCQGRPCVYTGVDQARIDFLLDLDQ